MVNCLTHLISAYRQEYNNKIRVIVYMYMLLPSTISKFSSTVKECEKYKKWWWWHFYNFRLSSVFRSLRLKMNTFASFIHCSLPYLSIHTYGCLWHRIQPLFVCVYLFIYLCPTSHYISIRIEKKVSYTYKKFY